MIFTEPIHLTAGDRNLKLGDLIVVIMVPKHYPPRTLMHMREFHNIPKNMWYPKTGHGFRVKSLKQ